MAEDHRPLEPVDEHDPIPGSSRSRVALTVGILILLAIVVFIVLFIISYNDKPEAGSMFG